MIKVYCQKNAFQNFVAFTASGHAGYAREDEPDIICAAVTALSTTLISTLLDILKININYKLDEGLIKAEISGDITSKQQEQVNLLFDSFILGCKQIAFSYGEQYLMVTVD